MTYLRESVDVLFTRRFGTFCIANLLSNIGTWAQQVAEPWLLLSLGASSFVIGLDSFVMAAPVWLLTLVGGLLADRGDRRRVITTYQSIQMLCPMILVGLLLTETVRPWMVVLLAAIVGVTDAISMPSFQTIAPSLVERHQIAAALALNATQFNLARIVGPAIAGLLMASIGPVGCFAVNAASYIPFISVALWILPAGRVPDLEKNRFDRRHPLAGFREIFREKRLRGALNTVFLTSLLCGPLIVFCPVLVKDVLRGDATDFSTAVSAFGAGGLAGAIALLGVDAKRDRRRLSSWSAISYGAILMIVGLSPWLLILPGLLALAGFFMSVSNTSANALLQADATPQLRGQTISLYMLAMRGGISIGSFMTGLSVSLLGARYALLVNGVGAIVGQIIVSRQWLRSLPREIATR
jgi:MFS family permease